MWLTCLGRCHHLLLYGQQFWILISFGGKFATRFFHIIGGKFDTWTQRIIRKAEGRREMDQEEAFLTHFHQN